MLKAVYFPDREFLEAEVSTTPSRIWRAIVEGKEVLKQGLIRRIGTGETTHIWSTNWLPRDRLLKPVACTGANPPQMVSELIDTTTATWDHQKLQNFFTPMDTEIIGNIPLCIRSQEDFWAWHYERRGVFSVRSAYRMLVNNRDRTTAWLEDRPSKSNSRADEKDWAALWNIKVPSKVRVFVWRLAHHSLPSGDVLHHRNMATQPSVLSARQWTPGNMHFLSAIWPSVFGPLEKEDIVERMCKVQEPDARSWLAAISATLP